MTYEPAYIAIDDEGYLTLFWGDGTEEERYTLLRGPLAGTGQQLIADIEAIKNWAEDQGYTIVVPSHDLNVDQEALVDETWHPAELSVDSHSDLLRLLDELLDPPDDI